MNSIIKHIIAFGVVFLSLQNLSAQQSLSLEQCRQEAFVYNKELKKAALQKEEAEENLKIAKTAFLPAISADANLMQLMNMDDITMPGGFLPTADNATDAANGIYTGISDVYSPGLSIELDNTSVIYGGLSLVQPIYVGGKIRYTNQQAKSAIDITEYSYRLKYSELIELTDQAFWNVAMVEANIEVAENYITMLKELEEQMNDMYEVGLQPASERLKVSVQKNEAELQLLIAKNGLKISKMYLKQIIGRPLEEDIIIEYGELDTQLFNLNNGIGLALENRNELKIMGEQVELSELNKKIALSDYLPQLGLSAQYTGTYITEFQEDLSFSPLIAAQLSIPVFQWGQGFHKQKAAQIRIHQAETELSHTTDLIKLEVLQAQVKVEEAFEAIIIAKKNIAEAEESLDEAKASFEVGLNTTTDLLNSQADWQKAKSQHIQALAQFKVLETTWQRVTGGINVD